MAKSESIANLAKALSLAQGEMEGAKKDASNPFFKSKYADLESVWEAIRKPLSKHGLSVVQMPLESTLSSMVSLETMLLHESGEYITGMMSMPSPKQDPQSYGSVLTYLRRYALQSCVGVAPVEDLDAEDVMDRNEKKDPPPPPQPKPPIQQSSQDPKPRTDAQHRKMYALMKTAEMDKDTVIAFSEWLKMLNEVETTKLDGKLTFTMKSASHIIENFAKYLDEYRQKESQYADGNPIQR